MSDYFFIENAPKDGDLYITDACCPDEVKHKIALGVRLKDIAGKIEIDVESAKGVPTDYPGRVTVLPIISDSFRRLLSTYEKEENLEFIEVKIKNAPSINKEYWVLNLLNNIKCFDWENSVYRKMPEDRVPNADYPRTISSLKIKPEPIGNRKIFRMHEEPGEIFVSNDLKQAIETNLTGIKFRTIDTYGSLSW